MRTALQQRQHLIQQRTTDILRAAISNDEPWIRHLGPPPRDPAQRRTWARHAATVAAYRDRYNIDTPEPLGPRPHSGTQGTDAILADRAARQALATSQAARLTPPAHTRQPAAHVRPGPTM